MVPDESWSMKEWRKQEIYIWRSGPFFCWTFFGGQFWNFSLKKKLFFGQNVTNNFGADWFKYLNRFVGELFNAFFPTFMFVFLMLGNITGELQFSFIFPLQECFFCVDFFFVRSKNSVLLGDKLKVLLQIPQIPRADGFPKILHLKCQFKNITEIYTQFFLFTHTYEVLNLQINFYPKPKVSIYRDTSYQSPELLTW